MVIRGAEEAEATFIVCARGVSDEVFVRRRQDRPSRCVAQRGGLRRQVLTRLMELRVSLWHPQIGALGMFLTTSKSVAQGGEEL